MSARWTSWLILGTLLMLNIHLKVRHSTSLPRYNPDDDTGYFRVESALQYRYARMIAQGEKIPAVDQAAQYPEGVRVWSELTMLMEYATAWTYRLLPWTTAPDFLWFVILWVSAVSSLSIAACYFIGLRLTRDPPLALAAAAAYGLSYAGMSDLIGVYGFQCFAVPLILASLACFIAALDPEEKHPRAARVLSGITIALALASWHVTRFYLATFFLAGFYGLWRIGRDQAARARLAQSLGVLIGFTLTAGILLPVLRESRFIISPTIALGGALWACAALSGKSLGVFLGAEALALGLIGLSSAESASYGHVYGLALEKLRHGLVKPEDPSLLGWDARMLWVGPLNSPELGFVVFTALPLALLILPRLFLSKTDDDPGGGLIDALTVIYVFGTIMLGRPMSLLIFFFCLCVINSRRWKLKSTTLLTTTVACFAVFEGLKSFAPYSRYNVFMRLSAPFMNEQEQPTGSLANELAALRWLRAQAGPGKPVLAHYGISGQILVYTDSPVLLNPKFEAGRLRAKCAEYLEALFSTEEDFHRFAKKYGALFYVYSTENVLDQSKDGMRYIAGRKALAADSAVAGFHFFPQKLKYFRLAYQNPDFRIYSLEEKRPGIPSLPHDPIYDINQYQAKTLEDGTLQLDTAGVLARVGESRRQIFLARILARMGQPDAALSAYEKAFSAWPPDAQARQDAERLR